MITLFVSGFPDEIDYGLFSRHGDRKQYTSGRTLVRELFGTGNAIATVGFASRLEYVVRALPPGHAYTVDSFIHDHSLLPFFAPFLPPERVVRLRDDMRTGNGSGIHMRAGLMASSVPLSPRLKLCLHCVEADQQQFGVSYYHRVHQLFGVLVCPLHAVPLVETAVPTSNQQTRYAFISAEQAQQDGLQPVAIGSESWLPLLLQIARDAAWLFQSSAPSVGLKELQRRYLVHLARHDLATASGQIRAHALLDAFQSRYPADLLRMLHCAIDAESEDPWLLRLVRSPKGAHHPLRHLLLIHLLEQTAESFLTEEPAEERQPFGTGPWVCLNPVCDSHGTPIITACEWIDSRFTDGRPVGMFTCPHCRFSYAHTQTDLPADGVPERRRIAQVGPLWEARLRELWSDATVSLRQMADRLGVDPNTVKKHAAQLALPFPRSGGRSASPKQPPQEAHETDSPLLTYRQIWHDAVQASPDAGVTAIRQQVPAKVYTYLYRHDRAWLQQHSPRKSEHVAPPARCDWHERDRQLATEVGEAAEQLKQAGYRGQISIAAIGRYIGQLGVLQKHPDKLPLTAAALQQVVETREAWAVRRIEQVATQAAQDGEPLLRWQLIKRAGVARLVEQADVKRALDTMTEGGEPDEGTDVDPFPGSVSR